MFDIHVRRESLCEAQIESFSKFSQVATYNEDFQSERTDRERAQGEIQRLKEENDSLRKAINMLVGLT